MKKILKLLGNLVFSILSVVLAFYIVGMQFFPKQIKGVLGYQTFVILSDSMESTLPVGSLVLSKNLTAEQVIPINTIVSFRVHWGDKEEIFTHYLKKIEIDETGKERYFTQGEKTEHYDDYVTYREDILGTYVLHVPYIGKFVLFLQSPFALIELGIILFISLINRILWNKFDREEQEALAAEENKENVMDAEEIHEIEADGDSEDATQSSPESTYKDTSLPEADSNASATEEVLPDDESQADVAEEEDKQEVEVETPQEDVEPITLEPDCTDTQQAETKEETEKKTITEPDANEETEVFGYAEGQPESSQLDSNIKAESIETTALSSEVNTKKSKKTSKDKKSKKKRKKEDKKKKKKDKEKSKKK